MSVTKIKDYKYRIKFKTESAYSYIQINGSNEDGVYSRRMWVAYLSTDPVLVERSRSVRTDPIQDPTKTVIYGGLYATPQEIEFDLYIYKKQLAGTESDHDEYLLPSPYHYPLSYDEGYFKYIPYANGEYTLHTQPVYHRVSNPLFDIVYSPYAEFQGFCDFEMDYHPEKNILTYKNFYEGLQRKTYSVLNPVTQKHEPRYYNLECKLISGDVVSVKFPTKFLGIKDVEEPVQIETSKTVDGTEEKISELVFSPRDENLEYDKLTLNVSVPEEESAWKALLKQNDDSDSLSIIYPITSESDLEISGVGNQEVEWNGFSGDICTKDGYYEMLIVRDSANPLSLEEDDIYQREKFYIDNTPPIMQDISITEILLDEETQEYKTDVVFLIKDPTAEPASPLLSGRPIGMYDETKNFDVNSFKQKLTIKANTANINQNLQIQETRKGVIEVSFSLPYKLGKKHIEVEIKDRIGNTGQYVLTSPSQGDNE